MMTLWVPVHAKLIVSPTDAPIDGNGPPLLGIAQTFGPTVNSAARERVVEIAKIRKVRVFMVFQNFVWGGKEEKIFTNSEMRVWND
jgi:hypothetical protein